jgi:hypothetical protein
MARVGKHLFSFLSSRLEVQPVALHLLSTKWRFARSLPGSDYLVNLRASEAGGLADLGRVYHSSYAACRYPEFER